MTQEISDLACRQISATNTTLESLAAPGWRQFEQLVDEAFRRQGYVVEETGLGKAIELIDGVTLLEMIHAAKEVQRSAQAPSSPVEPILP